MVSDYCLKGLLSEMPASPPPPPTHTNVFLLLRHKQGTHFFGTDNASVCALLQMNHAAKGLKFALFLHSF